MVQYVNARHVRYATSGHTRIAWRNSGWLAIALLGLLGCASSGQTQASLSNEAAAQLQMPGSSELASGGHDEERTTEGFLPAVTWREFGVDVSWDDIVAYFSEELAAEGWEGGGGSSGFRSTSENAVEAWHKGDRILRLGHLRYSPNPEAGSFATWYRVSLIGQGVPTD